jgi:hypothetical protein
LRRRVVLGGAVVAFLVLILVGRLERSSERDYNLDGIAMIRALVGNRISHPDDYRVPTGLSCLLYPDHGRVFALELCIDSNGRIVEAVDRRGSVSVFYTAVYEPPIARQRLSVALVSHLIKGLQGESRVGAAKP